MNDEKVIADECIRKWGVNSQLGIAIEECAELIVKIIKRSREVNGSSDYDICNEIADVEIMMFQLRQIYDNKIIDEIKEKKLKRLKERLGI